MLAPAHSLLIDRYIPECGVCSDHLPVVARLRPRYVRIADSLVTYGPGG
jgi:hypothetical protein